jgi:hypothetical protein
MIRFFNLGIDMTYQAVMKKFVMFIVVLTFLISIGCSKDEISKTIPKRIDPEMAKNSLRTFAFSQLKKSEASFNSKSGGGIKFEMDPEPIVSLDLGNGESPTKGNIHITGTAKSTDVNFNLPTKYFTWEYTCSFDGNNWNIQSTKYNIN